MELLIVSDLHFEFQRDRGHDLVKSLPDADVLVCAGDLCDSYMLEDSLQLLCDRWPQVVYVAGNHEFYGSSIAEVRKRLRQLRRQFSNLHYLDNDVTVLDDIEFVGTTMWTPKTLESKRLEGHMNDFSAISDAREIYKENERAVAFLRKNVTAMSIVVTHHLPAQCCIAPQYEGDALNCFFLCDMEKLIDDVGPQLWCCGHTHSSVRQQLSNTWILCNPFGYAGHAVNENFREDLVVRVDPKGVVLVPPP